MPARSRQPPVPCAEAERALGLGLHLCRDLDRLRLRRLRDRRLCPPDRRLAGLHARRTRASCSMRWSRRSMIDGPSIAAGSSTTATEAANTSRSSTPSAWRRPASSPRSAASATATTTLSPKRSTASTRPRSSIDAGRGASFEAVEFATLEWVDWFNNRRLLEPIGNIPPAEAEATLLRHAGTTSHGGVTQTKWPPANPGRFTVGKSHASGNRSTALARMGNFRPTR